MPTNIANTSDRDQETSARNAHAAIKLAGLFEIARDAVVERSAERFDLAATRLTYSLIGVRGCEIDAPTLQDKTTSVSLALDDLVGNARTQADVCADLTGDETRRSVIENSLTELNQIYTKATKNSMEGGVPLSSFMNGAEDLVEKVRSELQLSFTDYEIARSAVKQTQAVIDNIRHHPGYLDDEQNDR